MFTAVANTVFGLWLAVKWFFVSLFWAVGWFLGSPTVARFRDDRGCDDVSWWGLCIIYNCLLTAFTMYLTSKSDWLRWVFIGIFALNVLSAIHELGRYGLSKSMEDQKWKKEKEVKDETEPAVAEAEQEITHSGFRALLRKIIGENELTEEIADRFSKEVIELQKNGNISIDEAILLRKEINDRNVSQLPT